MDSSAGVIEPMDLETGEIFDTDFVAGMGDLLVLIDPELRAIIPPLSEDELAALEKNILADGCRDALVVWPQQGAAGALTVVDGHNRHDICRKHGIGYNVERMDFADKAEARIWMRNNQMGRRNLTAAWRIELQQANAEELREIGRAKMAAGGSVAAPARKKGLSPSDKPFEPHNTRASIAKAAGVSTGQVAMADQVRKRAPDQWEKCKTGDTTIKAAYTKLKKQDEIAVRAENIKAQTVDSARALPPTIVCADACQWLSEVEPFDMLLTDPPYSTDVDDIESFAAEWLPLALSKLKPTGRAFVFVGAYPEELQAYLSLQLPTQILVWTYRNTLGPSPKLDYKLNWQAILYYRGVAAGPLDCPVMLEQLTVQDVSAPDGRLGDRYHAWQKPMELGERFIRHSSVPGSVVADPFACTGTFLLAASKLGRIGTGCDIDESHIDIAISRGCARG